MKFLVFIATALSAQSVQCMEKESANAESELALSKLPARITMYTLMPSDRWHHCITGEFEIDIAVACRSGLMRDTLLKSEVRAGNRVIAEYSPFTQGRLELYEISFTLTIGN